MVKKITAAEFKKEVLEAELPVIVDCYADWCGPCKMMAPLVDAMSDKYEGKVRFCKLNVDTDAEAILSYQVMSIPNFLCFKNGEPAGNLVGAVLPDKFEELVKSLI